MDQFDSKILMQLQEDAKQNTKQIAAKIGLSATPTYERIKKLERTPDNPIHMKGFKSKHLYDSIPRNCLRFD